MKQRVMLALAMSVGLWSAAPQAGELVVQVNAVDAKGVGGSVGTVSLSETAYGLLLTPKLAGLAPGVHGFHVHEKPSCDTAEKDGATVPAGAAGGHFDPAGTGRHEGPYGSGHLGDLPPLYVGEHGDAVLPVLAPRLKLADVKGRALMLHAGGDNYSDHPAKLGGGGARMACGVIK